MTRRDDMRRGIPVFLAATGTVVGLNLLVLCALAPGHVAWNIVLTAAVLFAFLPGRPFESWWVSLCRLSAVAGAAIVATSLMNGATTFYGELFAGLMLSPCLAVACREIRAILERSGRPRGGVLHSLLRPSREPRSGGGKGFVRRVSAHPDDE
ncbi:hypothetical protein LX16_3250 [Stackebrandtia albiflava]|uniref:Uncharacterized protein n=1 Tax=Stackebrandtia albiflava TaxID=406432 RepID=A0A562V3T9_9ACTN|nr:hypothetical protein [Stackebrandtia albiflava]TWJ12492.1 hypothetical protein LX16_3250 [Stackebrandtia albiflava]